VCKLLLLSMPASLALYQSFHVLHTLQEAAGAGGDAAAPLVLPHLARLPLSLAARLQRALEQQQEMMVLPTSTPPAVNAQSIATSSSSSSSIRRRRSKMRCTQQGMHSHSRSQHPLLQLALVLRGRQTSSAGRRQHVWWRHQQQQGR
jgi:hypothetical protein